MKNKFFDVLSNRESHSYWINSTCLLFLVLVQFNCQTKTIEEENLPRFAITVGSGGGITGLFEGYNFYSDGLVEYWQHYNVNKDSIHWTSVIDSDQFDSYKQKLVKLGILGEHINDPGNMTNTVTYSTPDTTYNWKWNERSEVPARFRKWYNEVFQFLEQKRKEK